MYKPIRAVGLLLTMVWLHATTLIAQTTQASISGLVTDSDNKPVAGATVLVYNQSTGFKQTTLSNSKGNYIFNEMPLGGPYYVQITSTGFTDQKKENLFLNQGDALRVNMQMETNVQNLENVTVSSGLKAKVENIGAATAIGSRLMTQLPVNGRNFANLTELSPLAGRNGSISGQLNTSTNYTIDGMNAKNPTSAGPTTSRSGAPYSISIEAVREFKVVTNQYDVTYGRSGGGTVSAVTKSGTNDFHGSVFGFGRANELSSRYDIVGNKRNNNYSTYQYGFSLGGPIIKNKLHFFVAWDHQLDQRSLVIADIQTPQDELRLKIKKDTLDKLIDFARKNFGLSDHAQYGSFPKTRNSDAAFARIDWQINDKNLLTIRNNFTSDQNKLGLIDNTAINLYESAGNDYNRDNSLLATLRTSVNSRMTNELKLQHLHTYQSSEPGDELPRANIPRAIIRNIPSVIDGKEYKTNVQFGGHRFAQEGFKNNVIQLVDNFYWNTDKIKYVFGFDLMGTFAKSIYGSEVNGRFEYNSLTDFFNGKPSLFYREAPINPNQEVKSSIWNIGAYGQLQTRLAKGLDFTGGLRIDYAKYPSAPFNKLVFDELKLRTDSKVNSLIVQPRLQFSWDINEAHTDYIRLGAGIFASDINNYMVINNLVFDGTHLATVDVRGADIPVPDFNGYRRDPSTAPMLPQFQVPTINMNGKDVKVPTVYKANLSYSRYITNRLRAGITGFMTFGRNNYFYLDRNMAKTPYFTIPNEDNRGVFVPLPSMPASGNADWKQGRISNKLGRVLELNSIGKVNQFAVVVDATWQYFRDGEISASYTWNDNKDNATYNGNVANTATLVLPVKDDPRDLSHMSYSDNQFRHKVVVYGTSPTLAGFTIGVRYTGMGGTRYTLRSGVNSNGDFVNGDNDLAYIFDINNPAVAENIRKGLQAVLDNPKASQSIKDYIRKYNGQIAARNGGINGFFGILDLHVGKKFKIAGTHALELSGDLFNVVNFFDRYRGSSKTLGSQAIYSPQSGTAFDAATRQFLYNVNTAGVVTPSGDPYQFQIGLRYSF
ncbi:carboxypeptidase regulatory-like domain-containing protein [Niabella sp.]|uniref:TonB-dependent receptor n=1 Tax=Niabella sp. TaxID=1962976 RepID=UPI002607E542|nr:carboxypeptidase regulatory-like domain-containing protein [Niabella sp.]